MGAIRGSRVTGALVILGMGVLPAGCDETPASPGPSGAAREIGQGLLLDLVLEGTGVIPGDTLRGRIVLSNPTARAVTLLPSSGCPFHLEVMDRGGTVVTTPPACRAAAFPLRVPAGATRTRDVRWTAETYRDGVDPPLKVGVPGGLYRARGVLSLGPGEVERTGPVDVVVFYPPD